MGTKSTIKFYDNEKHILSLYNQFDGYPAGVGQDVYDFLKNIRIVNGFTLNDRIFEAANGVEDLALQYIIKYKDSIGNMYVTDEDDVEEWNYKISYIDNKFEIEVYFFNDLVYKGNIEDFKDFINNDVIQKIHKP